MVHIQVGPPAHRSSVTMSAHAGLVKLLAVHLAGRTLLTHPSTVTLTSVHNQASAASPPPSSLPAWLKLDSDVNVCAASSLERSGFLKAAGGEVCRRTQDGRLLFHAFFNWRWGGGRCCDVQSTNTNTDAGSGRGAIEGAFMLENLSRLISERLFPRCYHGGVRSHRPD